MSRRTRKLVRSLQAGKAKSGERNSVTATLPRKLNFKKLLYMKFSLESMENTEAFFMPFLAGY
jgi:hypothetical protein